MTDAQMITLVVAILAVFSGTLFNNSRIGDVNRHIDDKFALLRQQMKTMEDNIMRIVGAMRPASRRSKERNLDTPKQQGDSHSREAAPRGLLLCNPYDRSWERH